MYAIVRTGGKQYQVACGDQLRVEKLDGNVGDNIDLNDVLMVVSEGDVKIGQPVLENAKVVAKIAEQGKAKKIIVFKKKRRKGYRLRNGHRQSYTALKIEEISALLFFIYYGYNTISTEDVYRRKKGVRNGS